MSGQSRCFQHLPLLGKTPAMEFHLNPSFLSSDFFFLLTFNFGDFLFRENVKEFQLGKKQCKKVQKKPCKPCLEADIHNLHRYPPCPACIIGLLIQQAKSNNILWIILTFFTCVGVVLKGCLRCNFIYLFKQHYFFLPFCFMSFQNCVPIHCNVPIKTINGFRSDQFKKLEWQHQKRYIWYKALLISCKAWYL